MAMKKAKARMGAKSKKRPGVAMATAKKRAGEFRVSHVVTSECATSGLRGYVQYRELGIKAATRGKDCKPTMKSVSSDNYLLS